MTGKIEYGETVNGHSGFKVQDLFKLINDATLSAKDKIDFIKEQKSAISIADMFELQMMMNHLSQLSEMAANVVVASHTATMAHARGLKG
jgi:hypothetical protein